METSGGRSNTDQWREGDVTRMGGEPTQPGGRENFESGKPAEWNAQDRNRGRRGRGQGGTGRNESEMEAEEE